MNTVCYSSSISSWQSTIRLNDKHTIYWRKHDHSATKTHLNTLNESCNAPFRILWMRLFVECCFPLLLLPAVGFPSTVIFICILLILLWCFLHSKTTMNFKKGIYQLNCRKDYDSVTGIFPILRPCKSYFPISSSISILKVLKVPLINFPLSNFTFRGQHSSTKEFSYKKGCNIKMHGSKR